MKARSYVVNNEVGRQQATIAIRLKFPNPDRLLLPGQYVTVLLTDAKPEKQVVVPQAAVQQNQSGPFVLVVDGNDQVQSRAIKTAQRVGTGIVVTEGLVPGQTIVVEGIQKVKPGAKVNVTFQNPSGSAENVDDTPAGGAASDASGTEAGTGKAQDAKSATPSVPATQVGKPEAEDHGKVQDEGPADGADKETVPNSKSDTESNAGKDGKAGDDAEAK